jgi:hypothetical protein
VNYLTAAWSAGSSVATLRTFHHDNNNSNIMVLPPPGFAPPQQQPFMNTLSASGFIPERRII